jgi:hypothetical protein
MKTAAVALLTFLVTAPAIADGTQCNLRLTAPQITTLTAMGGQRQFDYDHLAVAVLESPGVVQRRTCGASKCLLVPLYSSSTACSSFNLGPCHDGNRPDDYTYCMVTDEFSQLGLILVMAKDARAVEAFYEWVNTVRKLSEGADTKFLPAWRARVTILASGAAQIERTTDDDASDATARIILALYIAAASPQHAARRTEYELLANELANRFAHFDFRDTRNAFGGGRFWPAGGKNAAANAPTNNHPFTFAGYYGDIALAMLAAHQSTGEPRYAKLAEDTVANYIRAAGFTTAFRVPPMKYSWTSGPQPQSVCRDRCDVTPFDGCTDFCDEQRWDADDAPRAVNVCKAAYFIRAANVPVSTSVQESLDSYCRAWMSSDGVINGGVDYARQYKWDGTWTGTRSSDYVNAGLGASLNFYLCPDDLQRRLGAAASMYDAGQRAFKDESCIGVYRHAFFVVNFGSAAGRDADTFKRSIEPPSNLVVTLTGDRETLTWNGSEGATSYEIARSCDGELFSVVAASTGTAWSDEGAQEPGASYIYKVRAVSPGDQRSRYTRPASAPAIDIEPIDPRTTFIRSTDITRLRDAANRLRVAAGLAAKAYAPLGSVVRATHIAELQMDVTNARASLGRPAYPFTTIAAGQLISGRVIDELRDAARGCREMNLQQSSQ